MVEPRVWTLLAVVALVSLAGGAGTGCGEEGGRPPGSQEPRDGEIRATLDALWEALGVSDGAVDVAGYGYTFAPDNTACASLDRDDRWFGERAGQATLDGRSQADIEDAVVGHLEDGGFTVQRYRSTHPDSPSRRFKAVRDELVVYGSPQDGFLDVNVRSGPCAPAFTEFSPELYEPDG